MSWDALRWPNLFAFQTIVHEDCEKAVVPNNLCFGKCGSIHFPGTETYPSNFCPHCSPAKFTTVHLRLNCTSPTPVVKMVMQVEECHCMTQAEHGEGDALPASSQESFIPWPSASEAVPWLPLKAKPQQKKWGLLNMEMFSGYIKGKYHPLFFSLVFRPGIM